MNYNEYVRLSLELHLFFDRIMKEHSLFLEAAFMEKNKELKTIANNFQKAFSSILGRVVDLSNQNISTNFLDANEMITNNTLESEIKTCNLSGIFIDTNITQKQSNLQNGNTNLNEQLINEIGAINKQTLPLIKQLIQFKNDILNEVVSCKLYTTNYPLLITHIMNEAKMYYRLLSKIESKESFTESYIYEQELFWNNQMKEHAQFIRGLLDPTEKELMLQADRIALEYENIIENYSNNPNYLTQVSLEQTMKFKKFKEAGEDGILNCKIKSIIIPLLADHILREANHFIRILNKKPTLY